MSMIRNAVPASLRRPLESSRFTQGLMTRKFTLTAGPEASAVLASKARYSLLPEEPEDARMTGVTRSLNRRLLALNLPGSLRMDVRLMAVGKIA